MPVSLSIFISSIFCGIAYTHIIQSIQTKRQMIPKIKYILIILAYAVVTLLLHDIEYNFQAVLLKNIMYIILFKIAYNNSIYKTTIITLIASIILLIGDVIGAIMYIPFLPLELIRGVWYLIIISNIIVCVISCLIIHIPILNKKLTYFVEKLGESNKTYIVVLFSLIIIITVYVLYNISINYKLNKLFFLNIIIIVSFFVVAIIFIRERDDYNALEEQYDMVFDYIKEFERKIEEFSLINHEYKNQMAVISGFLENREYSKAKKYVTEISENSLLKDYNTISELKYIPNGGIKGLLYYKASIAKNNNIEVVFNISKKSQSVLKKLSYEENKQLSRLLGVYLDNAIESAINEERKI